MNRKYNCSICRVKVVVSSTFYGVAAGTSRWLPNGDYDQDIYNIYINSTLSNTTLSLLLAFSYFQTILLQLRTPVNLGLCM